MHIKIDRHITVFQMKTLIVPILIKITLLVSEICEQTNVCNRYIYKYKEHLHTTFRSISNDSIPPLQPHFTISTTFTRVSAVMHYHAPLNPSF